MGLELESLYFIAWEVRGDTTYLCNFGIDLYKIEVEIKCSFKLHLLMLVLMIAFIDIVILVFSREATL